MTTVSPGGSAPIALDDLVALNDEIAALVRAGVRLDRGLLDFGRDAPGRLGRISADIGRHLAAGRSLPQALDAERDRLPPMYRAIVEAGLSAGRLPAALEGLADTARRLAELRRSVGLALLYPLALLQVAYVMMVFLLDRVLPVIADAMTDFDSPAAGFLHGFVATAGGFLAKWWVLPVVALLIPLLWWWRSGRGLLLEPGAAGRTLGWIPWFGPMLRLSQAATFADTLALMIEHRLPLGRAVLLSAEATGSRSLRQFGVRFEQAYQRGDTWSPSAADADLPPLLCWLLSARAPQPHLAAALKHMASDYRQRAIHRAEAIQVLLPIWLTVGIGGTVALAYALVLFVPWTVTLERLAAP